MRDDVILSSVNAWYDVFISHDNPHVNNITLRAVKLKPSIIVTVRVAYSYNVNKSHRFVLGITIAVIMTYS